MSKVETFRVFNKRTNRLNSVPSRILDALSEDELLTIRELGRVTHTSVASIDEVANNMEKLGLIKHFIVRNNRNRHVKAFSICKGGMNVF